MTDYVNAADLSCQGLAWVEDGSTDRPTFHGAPVRGYLEEMTRRGEAAVYGCEIVGCRGGSPDHGVHLNLDGAA